MQPLCLAFARAWRRTRPPNGRRSIGVNQRRCPCFTTSLSEMQVVLDEPVELDECPHRRPTECMVQGAQESTAVLLKTTSAGFTTARASAIWEKAGEELRIQVRVAKCDTGTQLLG